MVNKRFVLMVTMVKIVSHHKHVSQSFRSWTY